MSNCLGYYGASNEISHELDYDGKQPVISEVTKTGIINAIANDYPRVKTHIPHFKLNYNRLQEFVYLIK